MKTKFLQKYLLKSKTLFFLLIYCISVINVYSQDNCDEQLTCAEPIMRSTIGASNKFNNSTYQNCPNFNSQSPFSAGDYVVWFVVGSGGATIQLRTLTPGVDLDLFIFADECPIGGGGGTFGRTTLISRCYKQSTSPSGSEIITITEPGFYYAIVDGYDPTQIGNFSLSLDCYQDCSEIMEWSCGDPYNGELVDYLDNFDPIIWCYNDVKTLGAVSNKFRFTPKESGFHTFFLTNLSMDVDIFIIDDYCGLIQDYYNCIASGQNYSNASEEVKVYLNGGQEYIIIIDGESPGFGGGSSPYKLEIACPEACDFCCNLVSGYAKCYGFEEYNNGNLTPQANPDFTDFPGTSVTKATVVSNRALSGSKSIYFDDRDDVDLNINRTINGVARLEWNMYFENGKAGSWGIETDNSDIYPLHMKFYNGTAKLYKEIGSNTSQEIKTISYTQGRWIKIVLIFNSNTNSIELIVDGQFVHKSLDFTGVKRINQLNFFYYDNDLDPTTPPSYDTGFFIDNICYQEIENRPCPTYFFPVCVNGVTYDNSCHAENAGYCDDEIGPGECKTHCDDATPANCGVKYERYFLSDGKNEISSYNCTTGSGNFTNREVVFTFTPSVTQDYTFNALSLSGSSPFIIVSECCDADESGGSYTLNCSQSSNGSRVDCSSYDDNGIRKNKVRLTQGKTYYIFVEKANSSASDDFVFWVNCDCNIFTPQLHQEGSDVKFEFPSNIEYISHSIYLPGAGSPTLIDSLSADVESDGTVICRFPVPNCYEVCFYYRVNGSGAILKCCFKYRPNFKNYDCDLPILTQINTTENTSLLRVECGARYERGITGLDDYCRVEITPVGGGQTIIGTCGDEYDLPFGEYEICCWNYDWVCDSWNVCCKIVCLPFPQFGQGSLECGKEQITVEKLSKFQYKYTSNSIDSSWIVSPDATIDVQESECIITFPGPGRYLICTSTIIFGEKVELKECCVYTCIDDTDDYDDCDNSFDLVYLENDRAQLICKTGRPIVKWVVDLYIDYDVIRQDTYYGTSPIVDLRDMYLGSPLQIHKYYLGCCGTEESCSRRYCLDDFYSCRTIRPQYSGSGPGDLSYTLELEHNYSGNWRITDESGFNVELGNGSNLTYRFPGVGCYTIWVEYYDPIRACWTICARRICVGYPYDCFGIRFRPPSGDRPQYYTFDLVDECGSGGNTATQWMIDGESHPEYDDFTSIDNLDLTLYPPGREIDICVYYQDCLGFWHLCCTRLRIPGGDCTVVTPRFESENHYSFDIDGSSERSYWTIEGLDGYYGEDVNNFNLNDPAIQQFIQGYHDDYIYVCYYYRRGYVWDVCCNRICLKGPGNCAKFGEGCDYFRDIYREDFSGVPPGYPYEGGDKLSKNGDWWRGDGAWVLNEKAILDNPAETVSLRLDNQFTAGVQRLKVAFDMNVGWSRNLGTGQYDSYALGTFRLCNNGSCYEPDFETLLNDKKVFLKDCGGGDIYTCIYRVELLIDRSGSISLFIDGKEVNANFGSIGGNITEIQFESKAGGLEAFLIDNVEVGDCQQCVPPIIDFADPIGCSGLRFGGFGSHNNDGTLGATYEFNGSEESVGWIVSELSGNGERIVYESSDGNQQLFYPGFRPGDSYMVCHKYRDQNGCIQYCCEKVCFPASCRIITPYYAGDNNPENLTFNFGINQDDLGGMVIEAWYIDGVKYGGSQSEIVYSFPRPGDYEVCCRLWDPISHCYVWCCRKVCIDYPLTCNRIITSYDYNNGYYVLKAEGVQEVLSWNIDVPTGLPNFGYIGNDNPQIFRPQDFGIQPGSEIVVSIRYIDRDGCLKLCCRRICVPDLTPQDECRNVFPIYRGTGQVYAFEAENPQDMEEITWLIHVPGGQQVEIGTGEVTGDIDFENLIIQYPGLDITNICISIFYKDKRTGCYRVCTKCFCLWENPFDCRSQRFYFAGSTSNPLLYGFELDVPGATDIKWTLDSYGGLEMSREQAFTYDFAQHGITVGSEIVVSVRYFDPITRCYRVCCRRICAIDPNLHCRSFEISPVVNRQVMLHTEEVEPVWTIEGIQRVYATTADVTIDIDNNEIQNAKIDNAYINVCLTYTSGNCRIVCCRKVCLLDAVLNCDDLVITPQVNGNDIEILISDSNQGGLSTEITLPDGSKVVEPGDISIFTSTLQGQYNICRYYTGNCQDTISCCKTFCFSRPLNCAPLSISVNPTDDHEYTFSHNIIGGVSYYWDFGDGSTSSSDFTTINHRFTNSDRYTVCLTVTDVCGEQCVQCVEILVGQINMFPDKTDPQCAYSTDGSIRLNITGGIPPVEVVWSDGNTEWQRTNLSVGTYHVTVTDGSGFNTSLTFTLTAPELPVVQVDARGTTCGREDGSIRLTIQNQIGISNYRWSTGENNQSGILEPLAASQYGVTITDIHGCETVIDPIDIEVSSDLTIAPLGEDVVLCTGDSLLLSIGNVNASDINIRWYRDGVEISTNTRELIVNEAGEYIVEASNQFACIRRDTILVGYFADLIGLPGDLTGIEYGDEVTLTVDGAETVAWNSALGNLSCTSCSTTSLILEVNTDVSVWAQDINGCEKSSVISLTINNDPITGPNFLTPNDDGINDKLEFDRISRYPYRQLTIFNRWGQILGTFEDYQNDWEGFIEGKRLPDGVYYYILRYGSDSISQFELRSDLTLLSKP